MSRHLRTAIEQLKLFYIKKITETGIPGETQELNELTVSELAIIYKENYPLFTKTHPQNKSKYFLNQN